MSTVKDILKKLLPLHSFKTGNRNDFPGTADYWEKRYHAGGDSGAGSYNRLAAFKAEVINSFVDENSINQVIEFGCGDGNQLTMMNYPSYIGFDISKTAIGICTSKFGNDLTKSFFLYDSTAFNDNHKLFKGDLTLSLDVLYHIIEDDLFEKYMAHLFNASSRFVILYSNDYNDRSALHVRERKFTSYIEANHKGWNLKDIIKNRYPFDPKDPDQTSSADFYVYQKF